MADTIPDDDEPKKGLILFGRDVSKIPCFRESFLYGISAGVGALFICFVATSRPQFSANIGMGSFFITTLGYWFPCRYNYSKTMFEYRQIKALMKDQNAYEGSDLEREVLTKSETV